VHNGINQANSHVHNNSLSSLLTCLQAKHAVKPK
jgi:hypothetical protein